MERINYQPNMFDTDENTTETDLVEAMKNDKVDGHEMMVDYYKLTRANLSYDQISEQMDKKRGELRANRDSVQLQLTLEQRKISQDKMREKMAELGLDYGQMEKMHLYIWGDLPSRA